VASFVTCIRAVLRLRVNEWIAVPLLYGVEVRVVGVV